MNDITQFPKNKSLNFTFIAFGQIGNIGIECLSSVLKKAGHKVNTVYLKNFEVEAPEVSNKEQDLVISLIKALNSDIVGFSVRSIFFDLACKLSLRMKKELSIPIIFGGTHPTLFPEASIKYADIICRGEGEEAIVELANRISSGESIENIKGLWIKSGNKIIENDLRFLNQNLDSMPFPDFGYQNKWFIDNDKVYSLTREWEEGIKSYEILTARGCPYACTYCSNNILHQTFIGKGKFTRRRSIENVIEELKKAKIKFPNLKSIKFFDELFTLDEKWLRDFCEQYKLQVGIPFEVTTHPNHVTREIIKILKTAGLSHQINVGIQSGSEDIRTRIYKRYTSNEVLLNMANIFREFDLTGCYDLIMDNPFETEKNYRQALELLLKLRPFKLRLYSLVFFPETEITEMALSQGLISEDQTHGGNPQTHQRHRWGGDVRLFKDAENVRTQKNIFWSNLFILAKYPFIPAKFLLILSQNKFLARHPKLLSLAESLTAKFIQKTDFSKNYFKLILKYLLRGQISKLSSKIFKRVQVKPIMEEVDLSSA